MADPIIEAAVALKKELEKDDMPPELAAKLKGDMDQIMKIILGATQAPPTKKS